MTDIATLFFYAARLLSSQILYLIIRQLPTCINGHVIHIFRRFVKDRDYFLTGDDMLI